MRKTSIRSDFSRARFLSAAEVIAATRGVMEVSYRSVAGLTGAPVSSIQRHFATAGALRSAALEAWLHQLESIRDRPLPGSVEGVWELLERWFLVHARHPIPFALLKPALQGPDAGEWDALRALAVDAICRWRERLDQQLAEVSEASWRAGGDRRGLGDGLFIASVGVGPTSAALGDADAIAAAARLCWSLLRSASKARGSLPQPDDLIRRAARVLQQRPTITRIDDDSVTARSTRGGTRRQRSPKTETASWDAFLLNATEDLEKYRRENPSEDEDIEHFQRDDEPPDDQ